MTRDELQTHLAVCDCYGPASGKVSVTTSWFGSEKHALVERVPERS